MIYKGLIVLSGGQDSTTAALFARKECKELHGITFDYGQKHRIEIDIDVNKEAYEFVRDLQNAKPRIPTILFDDGSYLIEPTDLELSEKINSYLK